MVPCESIHRLIFGTIQGPAIHRLQLQVWLTQDQPRVRSVNLAKGVHAIYGCLIERSQSPNQYTSSVKLLQHRRILDKRADDQGIMNFFISLNSPI